MSDDSLANFYKEAKVISVYTRAQALADGFLVDVSEAAQGRGVKIPVAVTRAVWCRYVEWTDQDSSNQTLQDQSGRLDDILWMFYLAIKLSPNTADRLIYRLSVIPRDGNSRRPKTIKLKALIGGGDNGEPVFTIMLPDED
ncbi:MAG TPA: hypothetical protein PLV31_05890 [Gammaproteobacteria bacterium]|nr:hypothetical protein [Gammaproteobacteria bacterium]HRA43194.1 hypothetical protein [Gammaproteobacteria bacterium]